MTFFRSRIGSFLIAMLVVALVHVAASLRPALMPIAFSMNSASYQMQTEAPDWRPTISASHFQITFTKPEDEQAPLNLGTAKFYRAPAPAAAPSPAPKPAAPPPPAPAPVVTPPPVVLPVVKPAAVAPPSVQTVQTKAPVIINGVPQRYAPAPVPIVPAKAGTAAPVTAPKGGTAAPAVIPRFQLQQPPSRAAAPAVPLGRTQTASLIPGVRGPFGKASPFVLPRAKTSSAPLMRIISQRLDQRLRARAVAFGASLLMDAKGDIDPVRSALLILCAFLSVFLIHARKRLRTTVASTKVRGIRRGPFTIRRIRP